MVIFVQLNIAYNFYVNNLCLYLIIPILLHFIRRPIRLWIYYRNHCSCNNVTSFIPINDYPESIYIYLTLYTVARSTKSFIPLYSVIESTPYVMCRGGGRLRHRHFTRSYVLLLNATPPSFNPGSFTPCVHFLPDRKSSTVSQLIKI